MPDLTSELMRELTRYADGVGEEVDRIVEETSQEALGRVKAASPKRTGAYRRAWRIKVDRKNGKISATVYNAGKTQLTHLLEHGHKTRLKAGNEGKAYAAPVTHIAPVQEWLDTEATRRIEEALQK